MTREDAPAAARGVNVPSTLSAPSRESDPLALEIIRPVKLSKKERVKRSAERMMAVHDETLRKLSR